MRANLKPETLRFVSPVLLELIHFVMERGMLQGIQTRAEKRAVNQIQSQCRTWNSGAALITLIIRQFREN